MLSASLRQLEGEEAPTPAQINALLVAALQAQITLMRTSRVFPKRYLPKELDVTNALGHGPTAALACELYKSWKALGVTGHTLKSLLLQAVFTVTKLTEKARSKLFEAVLPKVRHGIDPRARESFLEEGRSQ